MKLVPISMLLSLILLTGCSSGPSDSEISDALVSVTRESIEQQLKVMESFGGGQIAAMAKSAIPDPDSIKIEDMEVQDMQEKENGDFVAKVTFYSSVNGDEMTKKAARITLTSVDKEWKIVDFEGL